MNQPESLGRDSQELLEPECIALPLSELLGGERRLDAEVYLSDGFLTRRDIQQSDLEAPRLGDLAKIWQPSRLKGIQVEKEHGVPYLLATQVFDIWPRPRKWLSESKIPNSDQYYVEAGWILVTRSGTVGNPIISYTPHLDRIVSDDLLRVEVQDEALRSYIYTYLRTRFGRAVMRSRHYGNVIKHLETQHLAAVEVPIIESLLYELGADINAVFEMRDKAYHLDMEARDMLEDATGEKPEPAAETGYSVDSTILFETDRRLDAYAHNPEALAVVEAIEEAGDEVVELSDVATTVLPSRFKRVYGESGIPYLSGEGVFQVNPEITKYLTRATDVDISKLRVEAGWLLMACSGQIYGINGTVRLANKHDEHKVFTHDLARIIPDREQIRPGYLQAVLSHPELGQPLVLRNAYGTSIPHLSADDISAIPVVRFSEQTENEIADAVEKASELRMKADEKENGAVARLEEQLEEELEKSRDRKQRGPLRIPLDFDEAMKRTVQVPPPESDEEAEEA